MEKEKKTETVTIRLTKGEKQALEDIGGSVSEGVRIALASYKEPSANVQEEEISYLKEQIEKAEKSNLDYDPSEIEDLKNILKDAQNTVKENTKKALLARANQLKIISN
jgi:hypothetical protein